MIDIAIMEGYGQTECTTASNVNMPTGFRFELSARRSRASRFEPPTTARSSSAAQRLRRVLQGRRSNARGPGRRGLAHTGDVGSIEDGFLTITDRKKDIIVTAQGKNVAPQNIENELKASKYVSQALVIGDRRPYLTALITLDEAETDKLGGKRRRRLADRAWWTGTTGTRRRSSRSSGSRSFLGTSPRRRTRSRLQ